MLFPNTLVKWENEYNLKYLYLHKRTGELICQWQSYKPHDLPAILIAIVPGLSFCKKKKNPLIGVKQSARTRTGLNSDLDLSHVVLDVADSQLNRPEVTRLRPPGKSQHVLLSSDLNHRDQSLTFNRNGTPESVVVNITENTDALNNCFRINKTFYG